MNINQSIKDTKVVLLGDAGVGKSSIILRFISNDFRPGSEPTLGAAFMSKFFPYNNITYKFQIWDTAGQEKYKSLAPLYYRDAQVAILVYDVSQKSSFDIMKQWVQELQKTGPQDIILVIVGNKIDLKDKIFVNQEEANAYAQDLGAIFLQTSAKENTGIIQLFEEIAKQLELKQQLQQQLQNNQTTENDNQQVEKEPNIQLQNVITEKDNGEKKKETCTC